MGRLVALDGISRRAHGAVVAFPIGSSLVLARPSPKSRALIRTEASVKDKPAHSSCSVSHRRALLSLPVHCQEAEPLTRYSQSFADQGDHRSIHLGSVLVDDVLPYLSPFISASH